jgi:Protein of unknown function (DUF4230)
MQSSPMSSVDLQASNNSIARRPVSHLAVGVLIGLLTGVLLVAVLMMIAGVGVSMLGGLVRAPGTVFGINQPAVVRQIQALQRIETVSYRVDKIISGERQSGVLPKFLVGDRVLLVVHGEIIAGVDLSRIQPGDVGVHAKSVSIHLPSAEIFTTRLDNSKTRVYSRDTGLFSTPDPNLESEVRQQAERELSAAALQDGILVDAQKNAVQTLTSLLSGLGFTNVKVR